MLIRRRSCAHLRTATLGRAQPRDATARACGHRRCRVHHRNRWAHTTAIEASPPDGALRSAMIPPAGPRSSSNCAALRSRRLASRQAAATSAVSCVPCLRPGSRYVGTSDQPVQAAAVRQGERGPGQERSYRCPHDRVVRRHHADAPGAAPLHLNKQTSVAAAGRSVQCHKSSETEGKHQSTRRGRLIGRPR